MISKTKHSKKKHSKTKHSKTKHSKTKHIKTNKSKYRKRTSNKHSKTLNPIEFQLDEKYIEKLLLYSSIINHFLFLMKNNIPKHVIKETMVNLFKDLRNHNQFISKNTTDQELDNIYINLYSSIKLLKDNIDKEYKNNKKNKKNKNNTQYNNQYNNQYKYNTISNTIIRHDGGFYFKSLEDKGDQPLTGNDLATLLDEMQQFFYNAQYTDEGKFLQDTNAIISMFRGDLNQFKGLVRYRILPQYYSIIPPFLKWANIKKAFDERKYEDLPDYLLAYQSYLRSRDEYLVAKGLKSPSVLGKDRYTGFFDKLANTLDKNITQFQQYRNMATGRIMPISLPV